MQVKATKRMSRGLQVNSAFTWSKAQVFTREDIYNPTSSNKSIQATDQPFYWTTNILYQTQKYFNSRFWTILTKDWQVGALLTYAAGMPLAPPASTATNNLGTSEQIPTGQPFFLKNPNCGCINPYFDQVLNPAAWTNPVPGQYGPGPTTLYYSSYRQARRPSENFNFGRNFRIKESMVFSIRAEFTNIFNRTQIGNPVTSNPAGGLTRNPSGYLTGGFGVINLVEAVNVAPSTTANGVVGALYAAPRQGTLIARFTF
jgi:hypothetical protein